MNEDVTMTFGEIFGKMALLAATGLSAATLSSAAMASTTFTLTGNSNTWGTPGNVRSYTADDGQTKVKVSAYTAAPASANSYTLNKSWLGAYSPGIAVTSSASDSHLTENKNGVDFIVFQFDRQVTVESAFFSVYSYAGVKDSDATIAIGNTASSFANPLVLTSWSQVAAMITGGESSYGNGTSGTRALNSADASGNLLIVAAGIFGDLAHIDNFKIKQLTVSQAAVPEPTTWAMMIAGFGLIGSAMRRRADRVSVRYA
jgi:hypothetical protein